LELLVTKVIKKVDGGQEPGKKFSGSKLPDEINPYKEMDIPEEEKMELDILRGDVIHSEDPTAPTSIGRIRYSYSSAVPQAELSRRKRYRDYEDIGFLSRYCSSIRHVC